MKSDNKKYTGMSSIKQKNLEKWSWKTIIPTKLFLSSLPLKLMEMQDKRDFRKVKHRSASEGEKSKCARYLINVWSR